MATPYITTVAGPAERHLLPMFIVPMPAGDSTIRRRRLKQGDRIAIPGRLRLHSRQKA